MQLRTAVSLCLILGGVSICQTAHSESGFAGTLNPRLSRASLVRKTQEVLSLARKFDRAPDESNFAAFQHKLDSLRNFLNESMLTLQEIQYSLATSQGLVAPSLGGVAASSQFGAAATAPSKPNQPGVPPTTQPNPRRPKVVGGGGIR